MSDFIGLFTGLIRKKPAYFDETAAFIELKEKQLDHFTKLVSKIEQRCKENRSDEIVDLTALSDIGEEEEEGEFEPQKGQSQQKLRIQKPQQQQQQQQIAMPRKAKTLAVQKISQKASTVRNVETYQGTLMNFINSQQLNNLVTYRQQAHSAAFDTDFQVNCLTEILDTLKYDDASGEIREFLIRKAYLRLGLKMLPSANFVVPLLQISEQKDVEFQFIYVCPNSHFTISSETYLPRAIFDLSREIYEFLMKPMPVSRAVAGKAKSLSLRSTDRVVESCHGSPVIYVNPQDLASNRQQAHLTAFDTDFQINGLKEILETLKYDDASGEIREFLLRKAYLRLGLKMLPLSTASFVPLLHISEQKDVEFQFIYACPNSMFMVNSKAFLSRAIFDLSREIYELVSEPAQNFSSAGQTARCGVTAVSRDQEDMDSTFGSSSGYSSSVFDSASSSTVRANRRDRQQQTLDSFIESGAGRSPQTRSSTININRIRTRAYSEIENLSSVNSSTEIESNVRDLSKRKRIPSKRYN